MIFQMQQWYALEGVFQSLQFLVIHTEYHYTWADMIPEFALK
jgi:hypothetical protein